MMINLYKQIDGRIETSILRIILMCLVVSMIMATGIVLPEFIKAKQEFMSIAKENPEIILMVWGLIAILFFVISSIFSILASSEVADRVNFLRQK